MTEKIMEKDETIPELPAKDLVSPESSPGDSIVKRLSAKAALTLSLRCFAYIGI